MVTDASGAVVPGASVTGKNLAAASTLTVTTNAVGFHPATGVLPGQYEIEVKAAGFEPARLLPLVVQAGDQLGQIFTLEPGAVTERIEMRAEAPLLQAVNASSEAIVDSRKILDMLMLTRVVCNLASGPKRFAGQVNRRRGKGVRSRLSAARFQAFQTREMAHAGCFPDAGRVEAATTTSA